MATEEWNLAKEIIKNEPDWEDTANRLIEVVYPPPKIRKRGRPRHTTPPKKLQEILMYRIGSKNYPSKVTLQETSEQLGVSKQYISQEEGKWEFNENRKFVRRSEEKTAVTENR